MVFSQLQEQNHSWACCQTLAKMMISSIWTWKEQGKSQKKKKNLEQLLKFSNYKYSRDVCM